MRNLALYIAITPFALLITFITVYVLIEWAHDFHREFVSYRVNGASILAAAYHGAINPVIAFHLEGKERVRFAEAVRNGDHKAAVLRHPSSQRTAEGTLLPVRRARPALTLIHGHKDH